MNILSPSCAVGPDGCTPDGETVVLSEEFTIRPNQQRHAVLSYRHYVPTSPNDTSSDPPGFSFKIQDDPIGFA